MMMRWIVLLTVLTCVVGRGVPAWAEEGQTVVQTIVEPTPEDRALALRAAEAMRKAEGTPGKEAANFLRTGWMHDLYLMLGGQKPATEKQLAFARTQVLSLVETAEKGPDWPHPAVCNAPFTAQAPVIDGRLDDPAWSKAAVFEGAWMVNRRDKTTSPNTVWRVTWDDRYLYFGFDCEDADLTSPAIPRDGSVFDDDCVEMFILPETRTAVYWEIVVGASGSLFDALHRKKWDEWGSTGRKEDNVDGLKYAVALRGTLNKPDDTDQGYSVEVAVPWDQLPEYSRAHPAAGQTLRMMLVRIDKGKSKFNVYAYQPELSWGHNIWNYGELKLVK